MRIVLVGLLVWACGGGDDSGLTEKSKGELFDACEDYTDCDALRNSPQGGDCIEGMCTFACAGGSTPVASGQACTDQGGQCSIKGEKFDFYFCAPL